MLDIAILIGTKYNDGGGLEAQIALQGPGSSCTAGLAYSPFGFKGRPRSAAAPDANGNYSNGGLALYYYEGSVLHTIPLDDGRRSTKLPQLDEGGSVQYADVDDAYDVYDGQGNKTIKVPAGKTVTIDVGGGVQITASSSGINITGVSATAPVVVGPGGSAAALPANACLIGASYATSKPSTILFATE